jgi:hypothetical protein
VQWQVWQILSGAIHSLSLNDYGRPWPQPHRKTLARLVGAFDADLCLKAARETREIVQSQDRAPNITGLFQKKLRDLAQEQQHQRVVRATVREALGVSGGEG